MLCEYIDPGINLLRTVEKCVCGAYRCAEWITGEPHKAVKN